MSIISMLNIIKWNLNVSTHLTLDMKNTISVNNIDNILCEPKEKKVI